MTTPETHRDPADTPALYDPIADTDATGPAVSARSWLVAGGAAMLAFAVVVALVLTHRPGAEPGASRSGSAPTAPTGSAATSTGPSTTRSSSAGTTGPAVPPAVGDQPGGEVSILVIVRPPTAAGCIYMRVLGAPASTAIYLLTGAWARAQGVLLRSRTPRLWFLTGHTVPSTGPPHKFPTPAAMPSSCEQATQFQVDRAESLTQWLSELFNALLSPLPGSTPTPQTRTAVPHEI